CCFFFSSRRRHTRFSRDWSSDVCSSDLLFPLAFGAMMESKSTARGGEIGDETVPLAVVRFVGVFSGARQDLHAAGRPAGLYGSHAGGGKRLFGSRNDRGLSLAGKPDFADDL